MNTSAILGAAGTGKSTEIRKRAGDDPNFAKVAATTGIAAVNLGAGVTTINSVLGFYNEESAVEALETGRLASRFVALARAGYKNLVIDEISMMSAQMLSIIINAAEEAEERLAAMSASGDGCEPVGIILSGDFLQLPPVKGQFCFLHKVWEALFETNLTRLTTIYRQTNPEFLKALNETRAGRGTTATMSLKAAGVQFFTERDEMFEGVTLVPTNNIAESINKKRFEQLPGDVVEFRSRRWGVEQSEWSSIPEVLQLKQECQVMILANGDEFVYVNGDQGTVICLPVADDPFTLADIVTVEIHRSVKSKSAVECSRHPGCFTGKVSVGTVFRETVQKMKPDEAPEYVGFLIDGVYVKRAFDIGSLWEGEEDSKLRRIRFSKFRSAYDSYVKAAVEAHVPYYSESRDKWVVGWIEYMPIRLAYASTIHKTQGLTLDRIQIDARSSWRSPNGQMCGSGAAAMQYVALSRCRTPENIRVVSSLADYSKRVTTAKECLRWV